MYGYIYLTTNKITGKQYVGQKVSNNFVKSYKGSGVAITKAFKKYGKNNFECHIIDIATTQDELNDKEYVYVELYQTMTPNGYNLMEGGGNKGKPSDETREKMRKAQHGHFQPKWDDEARKNHMMALNDPDVKSKMRAGGFKGGETSKLKNTGRKLSDDEKSVISTGVKNAMQNPDVKKKLKQNQPNRAGKNNPSYGKKWINDGSKNKYVMMDEVSDYLEKGWKVGMIKKYK